MKNCYHISHPHNANVSKRIYNETSIMCVNFTWVSGHYRHVQSFVSNWYLLRLSTKTTIHTSLNYLCCVCRSMHIGKIFFRTQSSICPEKRMKQVEYYIELERDIAFTLRTNPAPFLLLRGQLSRGVQSDTPCKGYSYVLLGVNVPLNWGMVIGLHVSK